jgi:hypothetical protein
MKLRIISISIVLAFALSGCSSSGSSNTQADEACSSLSILINELTLESITSQDEFYSRMNDIHASAMLAGTLDQKYEGFGKQLETFETMWYENYPEGLPNAQGTEPLRYTWDTFCTNG